jgi:hypothetical protein
MTALLVDLHAPRALVETPRVLDKYVVEAVGTFALVFTVGVGLGSRSPIAAVGIGAILMAVICAGGHRAGAHFNPAITLAATLWGRIPLRDAAACWLAQLAGGLCAAVATRLTMGAVQFDVLSGRTLVAAVCAEFVVALGRRCRSGGRCGGLHRVVRQRLSVEPTDRRRVHGIRVSDVRFGGTAVIA